MIKIILSSIFVALIVGALIYFFLKIFLLIYRPFGINRYLRQLEEKYNNLLSMEKKDIDSAIEDLRSWNSGDKKTGIPNYEESTKERLHFAKTSKEHEEEVHRKFLKLRERFISDYPKMGEVIVAYQRYLDLKLTQRQRARLAGMTFGSNAKNLEEGFEARIKHWDKIATEALDLKAIIEEAERKLDMLLTESQPSQ